MRVVVSLSTIPSRVKYVSKIIRYLLEQTYPIDRIYLNIPYWSKREQKEYPLPECPHSDRLTILRCEDYGPITKLYPTLQEEKDPQTLIITLDDDTDYSPDRIQTLVHWAQRFPEAAIGGTGMIIGNFWNAISPVHQPHRLTPVDILEGYSGCAYRRKFFDQNLIDYSQAPREAFYHDDVWISGKLAEKGIPRYVHPSDRPIGENMWLPGALSGNLYNVTTRFLPVVNYFRGRGLFSENSEVPFWRTVGFWILLLVLILLVILLIILLSFQKLPNPVYNQSLKRDSSSSV